MFGGVPFGAPLVLEGKWILGLIYIDLLDEALRPFHEWIHTPHPDLDYNYEDLINTNEEHVNERNE